MQKLDNRSSRKIALAGNGRSVALAAVTTVGAILSAHPLHAAVDNWTGNTTSNFNTTDGFNVVPATNDSLTFATAGSTGANLTDNLFTPGTFNISGITFSGPSAFVINPFTVGTNGFTLTGNITNSGTALETINDAIVTTAVRTLTMTTGGGNVTLGGNISGTGGGITTAGAGTLTLSGTDTYTGATTVANGTTLTFVGNNVLGSNSADLTNVTMGTGGLTDIIDLAGTTQSFGLLASSGTTGSGGIVTSSLPGGSLTLNEGNTNANTYGGTEFTGTLALTVKGNTSGNVQMTNANSNFSGGLTITSSSVSSLTVANLAVGGGLTGQSVEGVRYGSVVTSTAGPLGTGTITLDNGQLFGVGGATATSNNIMVTSRGGVIHNENSGAVYSGSLSTSSGSPIVELTSNSGNSHVWGFTGDDSGFTGTLAIDTTNIGGVTFSGSALGNSNTNVLWFGDGTNGGTGQVESALASGGTLTFGEFNNLNSGAVGSSMSGAVENSIGTTTATFSIGDTNSTPATFQGVIKNGTGTTALTKTGTNTQILSGANTYTGATNVSGGTLAITGSLASGTTSTVYSGGTLLANGTGVIAGPVNVNGGGAVGGNGVVSGLLTLATGSTPSTEGQINLTSNASGTFNVSNAAGLTLGGTAGNFAVISMNAGNSISVAGALTVTAGGASINVASGTAVAGNSYTLMTFASGTGDGFATGIGTTVGSLTLADPSISFGVSGTLNVSSGSIILSTTGSAAPLNAFWSGAQGIHWTDTNGGGTAGNFTTDQAGTNYVTSLPGPTTNVFFAGSGATNLTTNVLGQAFDINSLSFQSSTGAVIISGSNSLQIESGGITVNNTGGATISTGSLVLGSTQTWTNNSASPLTITAPVSGSGGLTIAGPVDLGGSSFASGSLTVNGALDVKGTSITTGNFNGSGSITNTGSTNALLTANVTTAQLYSGTLSDGGAGKMLSLNKSGVGALTLAGSNSFTGPATILAGSIIMGTGTALGSGAVTVDSAGTLDLNGQTITNSLSVTGTGASGAGGGLINSNTSNTAAVNSDMLSSPSFTVGGAGNIALQRMQGSTTFTLTDANTGTLTLGTAGTTNHNNLLSLVVSGGGTVLLNMPANFIAIDRGLTITNGTVQFTGASNSEFSENNAVNISGGTLDFDGHTDTTTFGALLGTGGMVTNTAASTISTMSISTTTANTYAGTITDGPGSGVLAIAVAGTAGVEDFTGANNYSGGTTVSGGATLIMGSATALGTVPASLNVSAGTLDLGGHSLSVTTLSGTGATGVITSNTSTGASVVLSANSSTNATYTGAINDGIAATPDTLSLVKNGSNTLVLTGTSNYSGGTLINAGTISEGAASALGTGTITIGDGVSSTAATLQGTSGSSMNNSNPLVVAAGGTGVYTVKATTGADYSFGGTVTLNNPVTLETTSNGAMFLYGQVTGSSLVTIDGGNSTSKFVEFEGNNAGTFTGNLLIQNKGSFKTRTNGVSASNTIFMDGSGTIFDTGDTSVTDAGFEDVVPGSGGSTVINAGAGNNLTLAGGGNYNYSGSITSAGNLVKSGAGTQLLSGSDSYTGSTNVSGGSLIFAGPNALPNFNALSISAAAIAADHGMAAENNLFTSSLTLAGVSNGWTGKLDLNNNDMVVQNGNLTQITNQVKQGYNDGSWNGSGGILSTSAASDTTHLTALGVIQNSADGTTSGATLYGNGGSFSAFDNATASASTDVLVKYTYYGDTDLNGIVDGSDYSRVDSAYLADQSDSTAYTGWFNGDFNYDGVINGSDYTLLDNAFNSQGSQIAAEIASPTAQITGSGATSAVPEPTSLALLGIGAVGLLGRRRPQVRRRK